jgi:formylglycine-generating enzyme required for sulfatase activity
MVGLGRVSKNKTGPVSLVGQPKSFLAPLDPRLMTAFTVDRIPAQVQCFTEPLEGLGNSIPLDMVLVPSGTFEMGSPENEPERTDAEGPQRTVALPSFFMGRYLVTQAQWRAVAKLEQMNIELDPDPSHFKGDNRPVEQVSWVEAVEFCNRLHEKTKRPYRLPSEAEWEYACRAGTTTPFAFGKTLTTEIANYDGDDTYNGGPEGKYRKETTPVNEFGVANAFGLCDMHGNVWEWCADHWHDNYEGAPTDETAWLTDDETASRVLRGGSWSYDPRLCRSATRDLNPPDDRYLNIGFRVSCPAPRTLQPPTS